MPNIDFLTQNIIILLLIIWESFWKGMALWKSAKKGEWKWFIPILIVNTFGILPIFYLWYSKQLNEVIKYFSQIDFKKITLKFPKLF